MRLLVQRVRNASVDVDGVQIASIQQGLLVFVGFGGPDTIHLPQTKIWTSCLEKLLHLRIFPGHTAETEHKFQTSVSDFGGEILLVSQFTLYAQCKHGRRPDFGQATAPSVAKTLYEQWVQTVDAHLPTRVSSGIFGANMDVKLTNWGPVTCLLDSEELFPQLYKAV